MITPSIFRKFQFHFKHQRLMTMACFMTLVWYLFAVSASWSASIQTSQSVHTQQSTQATPPNSSMGSAPVLSTPKNLPSQSDVEQLLNAQPDIEDQFKQAWRKQWKTSQKDLLTAFDAALKKETKSPGKEVLSLGRFLVEGEHTPHLTKHMVQRVDELLPPREMRKQIKAWILQSAAGSVEADRQLGHYYESKNHPKSAYYHYLKASLYGDAQASEALTRFSLSPQDKEGAMRRLQKETTWNKDIKTFPALYTRAEQAIRQELAKQKTLKAQGVKRVVKQPSHP
jgi:hypothetical protein